MAGLPVWADCWCEPSMTTKRGGRQTPLVAGGSIQPSTPARASAIPSKALAETGDPGVIAAVRWPLKDPPHTRMSSLTRADEVFDPLGAHRRSGGEILKVAHPSMVVEGSVDDWETWIGMPVPRKRHSVVPKTLAPVQIDREMNVGRYVEPNVVHHPITTERIGPR